MFGIVVDINTGFITQDVVHIFEDGTLDSCVLEDNEIVIKYNGKNPAGNMNKPQWQFDTKKWIDTAPLPPVVTEPVEPNEMEVLNEQVVALEKENKLLKAQVEVLSQTSDFHEELIVEMANKVYA